MKNVGPIICPSQRRKKERERHRQTTKVAVTGRSERERVWERLGEETDGQTDGQERWLLL
jgi:hypothetical protein